MLLRLGLISIILNLSWGFSREDQDILITLDTPRGSLTGFHVDYGNDRTQLYYGQADVFLGIPFVQPPIGQARFQKPIPMCVYPQKPWNATYYRPSCPQYGSCSGSDQSEDCLYLNVFSPNVRSVYKYPVMVWIHGGALVNGCAQQFPYKGAIRNLVSRGVVVVTIQYRLGIPGFFTTFTNDFPPNRGMLDQVEAIKWVTDNIQYFGGNPYKITLFGESAGGASVSAHTYSPLTQNLFQQAIMESGVALTTFEGSLGFSNSSAQRAAQLCNFTYDKWINNEWNGLKECLLSKSNDEFSAYEAGNFNGWKISQDDYFFPGTPQVLALNRPNIPILIGSMRDEFAFFLLERMRTGILKLEDINRVMFEALFQEFTGFLGDRLLDVMGILEQVYVPSGIDPNDHSAWFKVSSDVFTAAGFSGFIVREVDSYLANQNKEVYIWEQTYSSKVGYYWSDNMTSFLNFKPVVHTAELAFIWVQEKLWLPAIQARIVVDFDYELADWYGERWTNFAKYGRPTLNDEWRPVVEREIDSYYLLDQPISGGMRMIDRYRFTDDITWTKVIPGLAGEYPPNKPDYNNGTNPLPSQSSILDNFIRSTMEQEIACPNEKSSISGECLNEETSSSTSMPSERTSESSPPLSSTTIKIPSTTTKKKSISRSNFILSLIFIFIFCLF